MKKVYFVLFCVAVFAMSAKAQVTVGSLKEPVAGAVLELDAATLGFMPTRVNLTGLNAWSLSTGSHATGKGMLVYNEGTTLQQGFYYSDGTKWVYMSLNLLSIGLDPGGIYADPLSRSEPFPSHVQGMVIYNTTNNPAKGLYPGPYYNTGSEWVRLTSIMKEKWFYMPSMPIPLTNTTGQGIDLYGEYLRQLGTAGGLVVASPGAPGRVLSTVPGRNDLYYYITGYDNTVFSNVAVSATGYLTYNVTGTAATDATYMNIVFVEK